MARKRTSGPRQLTPAVLRILALNALLSGAVFAVSGAIALALVPILVGAYGLYAFGLLMLARSFLPTGALAALDLGVSEVATQTVARARVNGNWDEAAARLRIVLTIALGVALLGGLGIFALGTWVESWMDVRDEYEQSFIALIQLTGGALFLLFPALVADGVLKGFEAYGPLRATELIGTLVYAVVALVAVHRGLAFDTVGQAFLGGILLRFAVQSALAVSLLRRHGAWRWQMTSGYWRTTIALCWLMMRGKLLGVMQTQAPQLLIGSMIGAAAVGVYDIIMRLPRFAKSVLGLLNALVLPLATRLDETDEVAGQRRLGSVGLLLVPAIAVPLLAVGVIFSEPLLRYWMGAEFASLWLWQSVAFAIPVASSIVGAGSVALLAKHDAARRLLGYTALQVLAQYAVAFSLFAWLDERSFILGQALAAALLFAPQVALLSEVQEIPRRYVARVWLFLATCAAASVAGSISIAAVGVSGIAALVFAPVVWCGFAALAWSMLFDGLQRARIAATVRDRALQWMRRAE